ncbi:MAG TPA: aminodeoxychorismate/anthranilate synthase component II [Armatimonadota bacterium]|nr:aminodeoxychorismate/anthranilate synthase component II [Armatimonadota bacterium]
MLLLIDNYDSFTYNLFQYFSELGQQVEVVRNDAITADGIAQAAPECVVISPGPCTPTEAGISCEAIERFAGQIPILGVCLGHQAIGQVFGGDIVRAPRLMHGKTSPIHHDGRTIFEGLPNPFEAVRYHSLVIDPPSVPDCLEVSALTDQDEIMAVRHRQFVIEGVQFHPESIMTAPGKQLLANFLKLAAEGATRTAAAR